MEVNTSSRTMRSLSRTASLVVIALPSHKAHEDVPAQGDLAPVGGGAVGQHVLELHPLAHVHDGALVDAGAVVGAQVLGQAVLLGLAAVVLHGDIAGGHPGNRTGALSQNGDPRVDAVLMLLAGGHDGASGRSRGTA